MGCRITGQQETWPETTDHVTSGLFYSGVYSQRRWVGIFDLFSSVGGDSLPITADLVGRQGEGLPRGGFQRHSALEGTQRNRQTTWRTLQRQNNKSGSATTWSKGQPFVFVFESRPQQLWSVKQIERGSVLTQPCSWVTVGAAMTSWHFNCWASPTGRAG